MKLCGLIVVALVSAGCACKGPSSGGKTSTGTGSGTGTPPVEQSSRCDEIAPHVEELYRAAAERTKMTDVEVGDNVAMVLAECKDAPDRVVACASKATAVAQLESQCLAPLDDDGTEGQRFRK